jgi:hypothetical protein
MTWIPDRNLPLSPNWNLVPAYALIAVAGLCATAAAVDKSYPFFRFTQTQLRAPANSIQLAEFQFIKSGAPMSLAGVTVTNPGGDFPAVSRRER